MKSRLMIATLVLAIGVALIDGSVARAAAPPLWISAVIAPEPPALEPGAEFSARAKVRARRAFGPAAQVIFYLALNPVSNQNDIPIAQTSVPLLPAHFGETISATAAAPQDVTPGFYYLLACTEGSCVATPGTIHIIGQALSAVDQLPGSAQPNPPGTEYFPENPADGMTVGSRFDCPLSPHRQWPSNCVWVTSKVISAPPQRAANTLMYCPRSNPFPYQVAIGFDPLWEDQSEFPTFAKTNGVSSTRYKVDDSSGIFSYSGKDPSDPGQRGYAAFVFYCGQNCTITGRVKFLCSDRVASSTLP